MITGTIQPIYQKTKRVPKLSQTIKPTHKKDISTHTHTTSLGFKT